MDAAPTRRRVLVTGAQGYVGRLFVEAAATDPTLAVFATDIVSSTTELPGVVYREVDVCDPDDVAHAIAEVAPEVVVHLAAVVSPRPGQSRDSQHRVDVDGTRHVLEACVAHGVKKVVITSSGAAYGYHADNAALLTEDAPLRGNHEFAYAWHKRVVEDLLAEYRVSHPEVGQLVFRVSTVLGERVHNQITALFEGRVIVGLRGVDTPFCFAWDGDVVACLLGGVRDPEATGTYNLTGDGVLTLREIARAMGRPFVAMPRAVVTKGLEILSGRGLVTYGPEQVLFLAHRPVLSNRALQEHFGFHPRSSREVFEGYRRARAAAAAADHRGAFTGRTSG